MAETKDDVGKRVDDAKRGAAREELMRRKGPPVDPMDAQGREAEIDKIISEREQKAKSERDNPQKLTAEQLEDEANRVRQASHALPQGSLVKPTKEELEAQRPKVGIVEEGRGRLPQGSGDSKPAKPRDVHDEQKPSEQAKADRDRRPPPGPESFSAPVKDKDKGK